MGWGRRGVTKGRVEEEGRRLEEELLIKKFNKGH